ncbi:MerR family DNA-binding transcriptional regulator [Bacillus kexueae]|uniref:MerR family DNA-binding transcriptional regulator n=1 Tax=Aeribacillus kexueae TaxID=2078952 RepID=UPI001FAE7568|nr:MerR family DNA-binding transcriptional regulator [Bacillus kexueae]
MSKKIDERTYHIQQVLNLTGLSKQVIRKWEERYQIVQPQRLDNGYRILYFRRSEPVLIQT